MTCSMEYSVTVKSYEDASPLVGIPGSIFCLRCVEVTVTPPAKCFPEGSPNEGVSSSTYFTTSKATSSIQILRMNECQNDMDQVR